LNGHRDHNGQNLAYIYFEEGAWPTISGQVASKMGRAGDISRHTKPTICLKKTRFRPKQGCLKGDNHMEATVDILIISALIPDYWLLLAGLAMAAALALV